MNTRNEEDIKWLDELITTDPLYRKVETAEKGGHFNNIWNRHATDKDTMYIKIDDDVVSSSFTMTVETHDSSTDCRDRFTFMKMLSLGWYIPSSIIPRPTTSPLISSTPLSLIGLITIPKPFSRICQRLVYPLHTMVPGPGVLRNFRAILMTRSLQTSGSSRKSQKVASRSAKKVAHHIRIIDGFQCKPRPKIS